jgi:hypothetical protein
MVHADIIGAFFLLGGVMNPVQLGCPAWVWAIDLPHYLGAAALAGWLRGLLTNRNR